ncbi:MAG: aconitate hydratase B, partial [Sulfurovum sp.]
MALVEEYKAHTQERAKLGVPPLPLNAKQTAELVELLKADKVEEAEYLLDLLKNHVPAGVDDAAYVKAAFLNDIVQGNAKSPVITPLEAVKILGMMLGGYNVGPLIEALKSDDKEIAQAAADELKNTILVYADFETVKKLMQEGNPYAKEVIESWANAEWFTNKEPLAEEITVTV